VVDETPESVTPVEEPRGRILVIDDERGLREGCRRALARHDFEVDVAATGREGLGLVRGALYDVVLLDVMMPDIGGIELLQTIGQHDPDIVCIIITGYATVELAVEAMKLGAYDFIAKPFSDDNLLLAVNKAVERRRLTLETRRLQQIESEAQRLAQEKAMLEELDRVKSAFMRRVAHELRAPVAAIESLLQSILEGYGSPETQRLMQERAAGRARELLSLLQDLLDLSRLKDVKIASRKKQVRLEEVMRQVLDLHRAEAAEKGLTLKVECDDCPPVVADPDHIGQLWSNLISNAIKYTPADGRVTVRLFPEEGAIVGEVEDTGIGIAESDIPSLFQEFYRTDQAKAFAQHGTGLGLSIVKQVLDEYGGQIAVESEPGQGSTFTFRLPVK
jgi:two-component system sensor histidine kinase/response regulator